MVEPSHTSAPSEGLDDEPTRPFVRPVGVFQVWRRTPVTFLDVVAAETPEGAIDAVVAAKALLPTRRDAYRAIRLEAGPMRRSGTERDLDLDRENPRSWGDVEW